MPVSAVFVLLSGDDSVVHRTYFKHTKGGGPMIL